MSADKIVKIINLLLKILMMRPQTEGTVMLTTKLTIKCTSKISMMKTNLKRTGRRQSLQIVTMTSLTWTTLRVNLTSS